MGIYKNLQKYLTIKVSFKSDLRASGCLNFHCASIQYPLRHSKITININEDKEYHTFS